MKLKNLLNLMVLGSALTITAVGCKTKPLNPTPLWGQRAPMGNPQPFDPGLNLNPGRPAGGSDLNAQNITPEGLPPNPPGNRENWIPDTAALKAQTVYFEYDKSSIKSSEQSKLEDVANYLKSNQSAAVRVEGNCDERGTEEYNRALGERRALAAREYLVRLGISGDRVDTISYGNDKPAVPGHGDAAWSKNRRDEFVVLTPPNKQ